VKEWGEEIIFLRKVEPGPADRSYGIQVARLAGLPPELIDKARGVLEQLEKKHMGESAGRYRQMDLFGSGREGLLEQILSLDIEALSPDEVVSRLRELKSRYRMM